MALALRGAPQVYCTRPKSLRPEKYDLSNTLLTLALTLSCDSGSALETIGTVRAGPGTGATHATIGYDYLLSKRSSLFAYYTRLDNGRNGVADFAINNLRREADVAGSTLSGVVLGMRHNF